MPDKSEKERRKLLMNELRIKADQEFESNLPMSQAIFKELFDYLDVQLGVNNCDNSLTLTRRFLATQKIDSPESAIEWLQQHGGGCDCEVLANVEDYFEN